MKKSENTYLEGMYLFDSYDGYKSYWMKEDHSGYYAVYDDNSTCDFAWEEIEGPLSFLESSNQADRNEAARVWEKIKPYYQKGMGSDY